ncbi:MAG: GIY-YIG nuclease family protein [Candidatus Sumerlaeia bacterium]|nr:GIY-YIG nuclease family protein [Candidatus Sumerlaeia bacterium]
MTKHAKTRGKRPLVLGYVESVSGKVFSEFPKQFGILAGKQHGVYALYKRSKLYYVGLATNLRGRVKQHLQDKHAGKWDTFSLYLVREAAHVKEMESLVLRIAQPRGNAVRGRFRHAENLKRRLHAIIRKAQGEQLANLLGPASPQPRAKARMPRRVKSRASARGRAGLGPPPLAKFIAGRIKLQRTYKGRTLRAVVIRDGRIRVNGRLYNSPSSAGFGAIRRSVDGWHFWKFRDEHGDWVALDTLRRRRK